MLIFAKTEALWSLHITTTREDKRSEADEKSFCWTEVSIAAEKHIISHSYNLINHSCVLRFPIGHQGALITKDGTFFSTAAQLCY